MGNANNREVVELDRVFRAKRGKGPPAAGAPLGAELITFFKHSVQKRHTKLGKIAEVWSAFVPELLNDHCALESLNRGTLTVIVDSSSHLYQLKTLLLSGLQQQVLTAAGSAGLRKIVLKPGQWYEGGQPGERKLRFGRD